ncbi:MAG: DUF115 domain-containing protein [Myxococcales bacterium]|nr:MAG: DUF115 domain-containing protein [Myxococcales bacterium]
MSRYIQLHALIDHHKPQTFVEIGTWNGMRALELSKSLLKHHQQVMYYGFDLFEDATEETDKAELNVKAHSSLEAVTDLLSQVGPGFKFTLIKGNTRETLPKWKSQLSQADMVFIDGGHSVETIASDYENVRGAKVVIFDDYYVPDDKGRCQDTEKHGCNKLLENVPHTILSAKDPVKGGGLVQMAVSPPEAAKIQLQRNVEVKTKNCVPHPEIQANIRYSVGLKPPLMPKMPAHKHLALMCSGGPSLEWYLYELAEKQKAGGKLVCVKHAHDLLLKNNIVPDFCILLDPRGHVQDFIDNPHPEVHYLVASMCHPSTFDKLIEKKAKLWTYHAAVGADEQNLLKEIGGQGLLIGGGSSSCTRGISVMWSIGFRRFELFGYDSSYVEPPNLWNMEPEERNKFCKIAINGREFYTDFEKLAEVQDYEKLRKHDMGGDFTVHGGGMIPHVERILTQNVNDTFRRIFG